MTLKESRNIMQYLNKREKILDAMQQLMTTADTRSIRSVRSLRKPALEKEASIIIFPLKMIFWTESLSGPIPAFWKRERLWPLPQT